MPFFVSPDRDLQQGKIEDINYNECILALLISNLAEF